jgi:ribosomal protein L34
MATKYTPETLLEKFKDYQKEHGFYVKKKTSSGRNDDKD